MELTQAQPQAPKVPFATGARSVCAIVFYVSMLVVNVGIVSASVAASSWGALAMLFGGAALAIVVIDECLLASLDLHGC